MANSERSNPGIRRLLGEVALINRSIADYKSHLPLTVLAFGPQALTPALQQRLKAEGFNVKVIESISHLLVHKDNNGCALLVHLDHMNDKQRQRMQQLAAEEGQLPVIAISSDTSLQERLVAIRMGAVAFNTTPVNDAQVVADIKALTERYQHDPYQILIIEDQTSVAGFYAATLEDAGFQAAVISQPLTELMPYLYNHTPDLILLDLYMPAINGQELAGVIRQQENLISVPIVFLSNEMSPEVQMKAMCTGGDVFLSKPVRPADLLFAVESRVRRGRAVRNLVTSDPLTSVLNRREVLRRLNEEVARCQRYGSRLCIAVLDLDRFKLINDRFGHSSGDRVIKHFAISLVKGLRDGDIVGRLGGEEFLVLMPETRTPVANTAMQRVAQEIRQAPPESQLAYTFSGGVVQCLPGNRGDDLLEQADALMYRAKSEGRDRIICSGDHDSA